MTQDLKSFEFSRENAILFLEIKCQKFGLRFHSKRGFLLLKEFFMFLFPNGFCFAPSKTIIKRSNMQEFANFLKLAELHFPDSLTTENFHAFLNLQQTN
jgi:hypothetical protein